MTVLEGIVTKAGVMGKTVTVTVRRDSIKPLIWTMESWTRLFLTAPTGITQGGTSDLVEGDEAT
jgi:hypothetical protein